MMRKMMFSLALVTAIGGAACSKATPARFEQGIKVRAEGKATVAWGTYVLTLNETASGATRADADRAAQHALSTITAAISDAIPAARVSVGQSVLRAGPVGGQTRVFMTATVRVSSTADLTTAMQSVLSLSASTGCCGWLVELEANADPAYLAAARKDAVAAARKQADAIARAAGLKAGKILAIHEIESHAPRQRRLGSRPLTAEGIQAFLDTIAHRATTTSESLVMLEVRFAIA